MFASTLLHRLLTRCVAAACLLVAPLAAVTALAQTTKPNILVIMGDDVGWFNIGAYHRGIMSGKTPNLDKLAAAGHAVHRLLRRGKLHGGSGQLHHRRAADPHGSDHRRSGRCRRGHAGRGRHPRHRAQGAGLCDRPVRQEPSWRPEQVSADACTASTSSSATSTTSTRCRTRTGSTIPQDWIDKYGPRNLVHTWATDTDDPTVDAALGQGRQAEDRR